MIFRISLSRTIWIKENEEIQAKTRLDLWLYRWGMNSIRIWKNPAFTYRYKMRKEWSWWEMAKLVHREKNLRVEFTCVQRSWMNEEKKMIKIVDDCVSISDSNFDRWERKNHWLDMKWSIWRSPVWGGIP